MNPIKPLVPILLAIPLLLLSGCQGAGSSATPLSNAQVKAWRQQLRLWEPFVGRLEYALSLPTAGSPDEVILDALRGVVEAPIAWFSRQARSDFDLTPRQITQLDQLNQYSTGVRGYYRSILNRYQRLADGRQGLSGDLRDRFEQANQHGRRFLQTYQTLLNQDYWYDSPREFSWHAGN